VLDVGNRRGAGREIGRYPLKDRVQRVGHLLALDGEHCEIAVCHTFELGALPRKARERETALENSNVGRERVQASLGVMQRGA